MISRKFCLIICILSCISFVGFACSSDQGYEENNPTQDTSQATNVAPNSPSNISANIGNGILFLSWDSVSNADYYIIYYDNDASGQPYSYSKTSASNSLSLTGLTNDTLYYVSISAINQYGESPKSAESSFTPTGTVTSNPPDAPEITSSSIGENSLSISWSAMNNINYYTIYYDTSGSTEPFDGTGAIEGDSPIKVDPLATSYTLTGLTNGTKYYVALTVTDNYGESNYSEVLTLTPLALLAAPTILDISSADSEITISWLPVTNSTGYYVYYGTASGAPYNGTGAIEGDSPVFSSLPELTLSNLTNGVNYYISITTLNESGESSYSTEDVGSPRPIPSPPTNLQTSYEYGTIILTWDPALYADGYKIYYDSDLPNSPYSGIDAIEGTSPLTTTDTTVTLTGLTDGTKYYLAIKSYNSTGLSSFSSEVNETPYPPAPGIPVINNTVSGDGSITISWDPVTYATGYYVYYDIDATGEPYDGKYAYEGLSPVFTTNTSLTLTHLSYGNTYYISVSSYNLTAESSKSLETTASPTLTGDILINRNSVKSILELNFGKYWIGTTKGLIYLDTAGTLDDSSDDTITYLGYDTNKTTQINSIAEDSAGRLWLGSGTDGLLYLDYNSTPDDTSDDTWTSYNTSNSSISDNNVTYVCPDSLNNLWLGAGANLDYLDFNNTPTSLGDDSWNTLLTAGSNVTTIYIDIVNTFRKWIGTEDSGLFVIYDNGTPLNNGDDLSVNFTNADGLPTDYVTFINGKLEDPKWVGTLGGMAYFDGQTDLFNKTDGDVWTPYTTSTSSLPNNAIGIDGLQMNTTGTTKWIATADGVSYFFDNSSPTNLADDIWVTFELSDGFEDDFFTTLQIDSSLYKILGTKYAGLAIFNDNSTPTNNSDDELAIYDFSQSVSYDNSILDSITISSNKYWILSKYSFIYLDDNGTDDDTTDDTKVEFTPSWTGITNQLRDFDIDSNGILWFATNNGVIEYDTNNTVTDRTDDTVTYYQTSNSSISSNNTSCIAVDSNNAKWIGFTISNGVDYLKYDNVVWANFNTGNSSIPADTVRDIIIDSDNQKWIATNAGIAYFDDNKTPTNTGDDTWTIYDTSGGLVNNDIIDIYLENSDNLWIGTASAGINCFVFAGTPKDNADDSWVLFNNLDGLVSDNIASITSDTQGRIWISTDAGATGLLINDTITNKADDVWINISTSNVLMDDNINYIFIDSSDNKWISQINYGINVIK